MAVVGLEVEKEGEEGSVGNLTDDNAMDGRRGSGRRVGIVLHVRVFEVEVHSRGGDFFVVTLCVLSLTDFHAGSSSGSAFERFRSSSVDARRLNLAFRLGESFATEQRVEVW